jgi:hypothetical protein
MAPSTSSGFANTAETRDEAASDEATANANTSNRPEDELADVWAGIATHCRELGEYASLYIAANVDQVRLSARTAALWTVLGVALGLIALSLIVVSSALFLVGLSNGAAQLFGGRVWLGQTVVGLVILAASAGGIWLFVRRKVSAYRIALKKKYERRKQNEQAEYGTNVAERAGQRVV